VSAGSAGRAAPVHLADLVTRAALGHLDTLARSPLYAPALTALLETEMVLNGQRRAQERLVGTLTRHRSAHERRVEQEQEDRRALDARRAARRRPPAVWWHESGRGAPIVLVNGWTASGLLWPARFVSMSFTLAA